MGHFRSRICAIFFAIVGVALSAPPEKNSPPPSSIFPLNESTEVKLTLQNNALTLVYLGSDAAIPGLAALNTGAVRLVRGTNAHFELAPLTASATGIDGKPVSQLIINNITFNSGGSGSAFVPTGATTTTGFTGTGGKTGGNNNGGGNNGGGNNGGGESNGGGGGFKLFGGGNGGGSRSLSLGTPQGFGQATVTGNLTQVPITTASFTPSVGAAANRFIDQVTNFKPAPELTFQGAGGAYTPPPISIASNNPVSLLSGTNTDPFGYYTPQELAANGKLPVPDPTKQQPAAVVAGGSVPAPAAAPGAAPAVAPTAMPTPPKTVASNTTTGTGTGATGTGTGTGPTIVTSGDNNRAGAAGTPDKGKPAVISDCQKKKQSFGPNGLDYWNRKNSSASEGIYCFNDEGEGGPVREQLKELINVCSGIKFDDARVEKLSLIETVCVDVKNEGKDKEVDLLDLFNQKSAEATPAPSSSKTGKGKHRSGSTPAPVKKIAE